MTDKRINELVKEIKQLRKLWKKISRLNHKNKLSDYCYDELTTKLFELADHNNEIINESVKELNL